MKNIFSISFVFASLLFLIACSDTNTEKKGEVNEVKEEVVDLKDKDIIKGDDFSLKIKSTYENKNAEEIVVENIKSYPENEKLINGLTLKQLKYHVLDEFMWFNEVHKEDRVFKSTDNEVYIVLEVEAINNSKTDKSSFFLVSHNMTLISDSGYEFSRDYDFTMLESKYSGYLNNEEYNGLLNPLEKHVFVVGFKVNKELLEKENFTLNITSKINDEDVYVPLFKLKSE